MVKYVNYVLLAVLMMILSLSSVCAADGDINDNLTSTSDINELITDSSIDLVEIEDVDILQHEINDNNVIYDNDQVDISEINSNNVSFTDSIIDDANDEQVICTVDSVYNNYTVICNSSYTEPQDVSSSIFNNDVSNNVLTYDVSDDTSDVVDDTVKALQLNSVDATEDNILAGTYVLQRPFVMATMGEISEQNDLVKAFFDFIHSEEGQQVITSVGLIIPQ